MIEETLNGLNAAPARKARIPVVGWNGDSLKLSSGVTLTKGSDASGYSVHISGQGITPELLDRLLDQIAYLLDKPD